MEKEFNLLEKYLYRDLGEEIEREIKLKELYKVVMVELGFPPIDTLFPKEMEYITKLKSIIQDRDNLVHEVKDFLIECYNKNELNLLLRNWGENVICHNRIHILREIITGHSSRLYYLTVPTMLSQIEGIIVEGFSHSGKMNFKRQKDYLSILLSAKDIGTFDDAVNDYFLNTILVEFEHGKDIKSDLSRHAILHGADTNFGTEINSLKCILIFDYLLFNFGKIHK